MKRPHIISIFITLCLSAFCSLQAEDYEYDYFSKDKKKYVPFSDYIPKVRMHYQTVPHYLEDYYLLYGMKQYYNENSLRMNIERLKTAMNCRFRHPSQALVKIESEEEYKKYRYLMFMHINMIIMRNYLKIGARYDKRKIYFYNLDFAREINESLQIADRMYSDAMPYWEKAREFASQASSIKITTDMGFIESERYSIIKGEVDYTKIINDYREAIRAKREKLDTAINAVK